MEIKTLRDMIDVALSLTSDEGTFSSDDVTDALELFDVLVKRLRELEESHGN